MSYLVVVRAIIAHMHHTYNGMLIHTVVIKRSMQIDSRPVGRGGSRGFARTPLLAPKRFYIHCYSTFWVPYRSTSLAAIENYRCPSKSGCSYAGLFLEDQHRTRSRKLFTLLRWKLSIRPRINTCGNKLLCQALESSPVPGGMGTDLLGELAWV